MQLRSLLLLLPLSVPLSAQTGRVIVSHDDWPLRPNGFGTLTDAPRFAENLARWFAPEGSGSFLAYSTDISLTHTLLANTLTAAGHQWTVDSALPFDLPTLAGFDALFLTGNAGSGFDTQVAIDYVQAGGDVYVALGTVFGDDKYAPLLHAFGLDMASDFNALDAILEPASPHPIFHGVDALWHRTGRSILDGQPGDCTGVVLESLGADGLFATHQDAADLELTVEPSLASPGETVTLDVRQAPAGDLLVIALTAIDGSPTFAVLDSGLFGADCARVVQLPLPSSLGAAQFTLQAGTLDAALQLVLTPPRTLTVL